VKEQIPFKIYEKKWVGGLLYYANRIDNLLGHKGKTGIQLSMEFNEHLKTMGVNVIHEEVFSIDRADDHFIVNDQDFSHVILATGSKPNELEVPRALYYIEDPGALADKDVLIIGGGDLAFDNAVRCTRSGAKVTLLLRGEPKANRSLMAEARELGIKEIKGDPKEIIHDGSSFRFGYLKYDSLAVFIGRRPNRSLIEKWGELEVELPEFSTSIKGLYVVGDAALGTLSQTALASGSGLAAAMHIAKTVRCE
jgi:thioredoxin reductase (NADPH)